MVPTIRLARLPERRCSLAACLIPVRAELRFGAALGHLI